jgi:hypothetical protein
MLCGSEKGIRSIVAAKSSGVTAKTAFGNLAHLNWRKAQLLCQVADFGAGILVVARNECMCDRSDALSSTCCRWLARQ